PLLLRLWSRQLPSSMTVRPSALRAARKVLADMGGAMRASRHAEAPGRGWRGACVGSGEWRAEHRAGQKVVRMKAIWKRRLAPATMSLLEVRSVMVPLVLMRKPPCPVPESQQPVMTLWVGRQLVGMVAMSMSPMLPLEELMVPPVRVR